MTFANSSYKYLAVFIACAFAFSLSFAPMARAMHDDNTSTSTAMSHCDDNNNNNDEHGGEKHHSTSTVEHANCAKADDNHNDGENNDDSHHGASSLEGIGHNLDTMSVPQLESLLKLLQQLVALILASKGA